MTAYSLASLFTALLALGDPRSITADPKPQTIIGGQEADPCAWPSAGRVSYGAYNLAGVLIHPRVVALTSGLKVTIPDAEEYTLSFGYPASDGAALVIQTSTSNCHFDGPFGVCVLDQPAPLAYAPPLFGCEEARLVEGADVTIVGFGDIGEVSNTAKRAAPMTVGSISGSVIQLEGDAGPCAGDAGSPAFLRMEDGSWRTAAIANDAACGVGASIYLSLADRVPWIEEVTGLDVTPCHDALGLPDVGGDCGGFFAGDEDDYGAWPSNYCSAGPVGGEGGVCSGDEDAPSVEITSPAADDAYPDVPSAVLVEIAADDGDGLGVRDVRLSINGEVLPNERTEAPYTFEMELPEGVWTLTALARDWGGNEAVSEEVELIVGDPPLPPSGSTTADPGETDGPNDDSGSTSGISEGETGSVEPDSDTDAGQATNSSGGCNTSGATHGWLALLLGAGLFVRRRRTPSARQA